MTSSTPFERQAQVGQGFGIIDRPRLLNKLRSVQDYKLTLISAPPGYGKTTLAAQFVRQSPYPVAWHTIEERERDVTNLHAQSLAALSRIVPSIKKQAVPPGYAPAELATLIADSLRDEAIGDTIYLMDDVQHLAGSPSAEAWLRTLVALLPKSCHLILISRILPDLPLVEMIARREVLAIGQEELRLTGQEIHDLAGMIVGAPPPVDRITELATRLEGWPAGTVLALHPLPPDLERAMLRGGEGPEALFDALASTMLNAQPPEIRDFLLASSTLSRLTPELCSAALGLPNSLERIAEIQSRHLFLGRAPGGLFYHALFRSFLQRQLREDFPHTFVDLHLRAAAWFERQDQVDEAFEHYMAADAATQAAQIAERVAQSYFRQGHTETLLNWGMRLNQAGVAAPRLLHACAMVHIDRYEYPAAESELGQAAVMFAASNDQGGLTSVQVQQAMLQLQRGHYQEAGLLAGKLVESRAENGNMRGRGLNILGVAHMHMGRIEDAASYFENALPLYREEGDAYAISQLLQNLGTAYSRLGRLNDASACLQEVVALRRSLGSTSALALALNNLGFFYHRSSDYKQALSSLQEGLSVVARFPNRRAESYLLWSMGDLQRDRAGFDEAAQRYNRALELLGNGEPSLRCSILTSVAVLRRWQGKLDESLTLAVEARALADKHSIVVEGAVAEAALWMARALEGQSAEAAENLDCIVDSLKQQSVRSELVELLGLCAHVALLNDDERAAQRYLREAMQIGEEVGSVQPLAAVVMHTPQLDSFISAKPDRYELLVRELRRLREARLKVPREVRITDHDAPRETYSLRVYTMGRISIERDGEPIPSSEWRATAARELFFYLLFVGPESREQISLDFWPDSPPARVRSNFHTTLYRARQALGENVIAFQDGLYLINPDIDVWCDAQELETVTSRARLFPPRDVRTEDLWRRAVALYRGEFLSSVHADWVDTRREALRESHLEALIGLGECARARGSFKEALHSFRQVLKVEPYREDVHRAIMTCYALKGERKKIHAHFEELQRLLRHELSAEPSAETSALAYTLMH